MPTRLEGPQFHLPPPGRTRTDTISTAAARGRARVPFAAGEHAHPRVDGARRRDVVLDVVDAGDGRLHLVRGSREVGWVEHRTIGFRGFANTDAARMAASLACGALSRWIARQWRTAPVPPATRPLDVHRRGADEVLALDGVPVGRIRRFVSSGATLAGDDAGFELFLPARVTVGSEVRAAQAVERALAARESAGHCDGAPHGDHP